MKIPEIQRAREFGGGLSVVEEGAGERSGRVLVLYDEDAVAGEDPPV